MSERLPLLYDLHAAQKPNNAERGIPRFIKEHAAALLSLSTEADLQFLADPRWPIPEALKSITQSGRFIVPGATRTTPHKFPSPPFIYYIPSPFELGEPLEALWPRAARSPRNLLAVTLYDLIPLRYPERYLALAPTRHAYETRLELIRQADLVLTISEASARDAMSLLRLSPERVVNIGAGVSDFWQPAEDPKAVFHRLVRECPSVRPGFLLYTGGVDFRKNMEGLVSAYALLPLEVKHRHQLVIVCRISPSEEESVRAFARDRDTAKNIVFTNYVSDETLRALYQTTRLFVFPSFYEGFGLPVLEALRCGAPTIASNTSSLPELLPDTQHRFDPHDGAEIARAIQTALRRETKPSEVLRESQATLAKHTWSEVARRTLHACSGLSDRFARREVRRFASAPRRTLAFFSPLPPQPSGVAVYSDRLIQSLNRKIDVHSFVDGNDPVSGIVSCQGSRGLSHHVFPIQDAIEHFDYIVYALGNSAFHTYALETLEKSPGAVVAHDIRLAGLYASLHRTHGKSPLSFAASLLSQHPDVPRDLAERGYVTAEETAKYDIRMIRDILELSTQFFVHSEFAANSVRQAFPESAAKVAVLRFGVSIPHQPDRSTSEKRSPFIATFGIPSPSKSTDLFLGAVPHVLRRHPQARFAVVGGCAPDYAAALLEIATLLEITSVVEFTGYLDESAYSRYLERTACAVQLRRTTNGETSAAVGDCLRYGIPTIVSDLGAAREYPPGTVDLLPVAASEVELAEAIIALLEDPSRSTQLSSAGLAYAKAHSFDAAAESLLRALS